MLARTGRASPGRLRIAAHVHGDIGVCGRRRPARAVHHVINATGTGGAEEHREQVVKLAAGAISDPECVAGEEESEICLCSWSSQIRRPLLSSWEYPAGFRSRNTVDTVEGKGRDSKVFIQAPRKRSLSRDELRR